MKNSKKLLILLPMILLLVTACGSKKDEAAKVDGDNKTEVKEEVKTEVKEESQYNAETGIFQSEAGNFSIDFAGEPVFSAEPVDSGDGTSITMNTFVYEEGEDKVLMLAYSDIPVGEIKKDEARLFLKNEQSGALGSFGVDKPEEEKQSDYGDYPGLFYKAKTPDGFYVTAQTYLVGGRLYQIEILTTKAYPSEEEIKNFSGSFKLLK